MMSQSYITCNELDHKGTADHYKKEVALNTFFRDYLNIEMCGREKREWNVQTVIEDEFCGCNLGQIWWKRTWKRPRYPTHSSPWSLLVRPVFRSCRYMRPVGKPGSRKACPLWRRIRLWPFNQIRHTQVHWTW